MKSFLHILIASGLFSLALPAGKAAAGAAPAPQIHWGGSTNPNSVSEAKNLPSNPSATPPLWEIKVGTHQYSIPTLDRGRIYIGANDAAVERPGFKPTGGGVLMCVEQSTGKLIWRMPSPRFFGGVKPPYHYDQWNCGICSGPVVDGDRVFVVSGRGEILCLDREGQANGNDGPFKDELNYMGVTKAPDSELGSTDGDILWKYEFIPELDVVPHDVCGSTLLIVGDLLYACNSNGIDDRHDKIPKPQAPTLIVLDKKTGKLVARDNEKIGERLLHCNWSSPIAGQVGNRTLIFFGAGDGILYAFDPPTPAADGPVQTLKKVWSYDCNPPHFRMLDGQPVPYSKHNLNTTSGPSEVIGVPVFHKGRIYVVIGQSPLHGMGRGCLSCVDAATGAKIWTSELIDRSLATPAVSGDLLFVSDASGNLHCFNANTGERHWVHELGSKAWCASAFVADGKVYAGGEGNVLWVLKAEKEKQVLSRTLLKSAPITPVAVDGILYLPTQRSLAAIPGMAGAGDKKNP